MTYEEVKKDWISNEIILEKPIDEFGTILVLSKVNGISYDVHRFFEGGGSYQVSCDKQGKPLEECVEYMIDMAVEYS